MEISAQREVTESFVFDVVFLLLLNTIISRKKVILPSCSKKNLKNQKKTFCQSLLKKMFETFCFRKNFGFFLGITVVDLSEMTRVSLSEMIFLLSIEPFYFNKLKKKTCRRTVSVSLFHEKNNR